MTGPEIHHALLSTRQFHRSCEAMLRAADGFLTDIPHGFTPAMGALCVPDAAYSIGMHDKWVPDVLVRLYNVPNRPALVAWVSILLLPRPDANYVPYGEPLVSSGWAALRSPKLRNKVAWGGRTLWWTPHPLDGSFVDARWPKSAEHVRVAGLRLVDVADSGSLEERVLHPLISELATA